MIFSIGLPDPEKNLGVDLSTFWGIKGLEWLENPFSQLIRIPIIF